MTNLKVLLLYCFVALQDGQVAETKTKLRAGDTLVVSTVAGNVQLNFLRCFLNGGFQVHLQHNELLHQASLSSSYQMSLLHAPSPQACILAYTFQSVLHQAKTC